MSKAIKVRSCSDCPALHQNSEYPESYCKVAKRTWGMGYYRNGDPIPDWCPLRKESYLISLGK